MMDSAVIVVGAGPTGLMLAGELRLAGADVIVLERLERPSGESRALGITVRTQEVLDQRGLLPRFGEIPTTPMGHFGGLLIDFGVLDSVHRSAHSYPQARTEAILGEWAAELGADVRRGVQVVGLDQDGYGVDVHIDGPEGRGTLRASYVVGCDGSRSTVRKLAGFDFPGTPATMEMYLADVVGCDLPENQFGKKLAHGMVMSAPLEGGITRIIACERGRTPAQRDRTVLFTEIAEVWQRITGDDISHGAAVWASSFTDAARQVTECRRGRVLVAGDAAHIHLPAGGQGMNAGIQDAVNLGWKLAAVATGWAPGHLLDSYHNERHPVHKRLLMNTRAQGLLFLGGPEVDPLREVLGELLAFEDVRRVLAGMVSGLEIRYDVGGTAEHPLLGRRIPHQELVGDNGKTSTTEALHAGTGVLLDFRDDARLRRVASAWTGRVAVVTATPHDLAADSPLAGVDALLVRPDGHVVWTGAGDPARALYRWFGAAR
jgi:bifunctional hydroxylase/dehydrase